MHHKVTCIYANFKLQYVVLLIIGSYVVVKLGIPVDSFPIKAILCVLQLSRIHVFMPHCHRRSKLKHRD